MEKLSVFDTTQLFAMQAALTNQIALIQGPPGLEIAQSQTQAQAQCKNEHEQSYS